MDSDSQKKQHFANQSKYFFLFSTKCKIGRGSLKAYVTYATNSGLFGSLNVSNESAEN